MQGVNLHSYRELNRPISRAVNLFFNTGKLGRGLMARNNVKLGNISLTKNDNIVYNLNMVGSTIIFVLRICLVAVVATFFWRLIEPKNKQARVLRAGLLVVGLLVTLAVARIIGV